MTQEQVDFLKTWANRPDPMKRPAAYPKQITENPERIKKAQEHIANANFMMRYWMKHIEWVRISPRGSVVGFSCPFFDTDTRLCTAYEKRPPICSGFPWYGKDPAEQAANPMTRPSERCSYWEDVPVIMRPTNYKGSE